MKDFVNLFGLRYSAVCTHEAGENSEPTKSKKNPKSLQPKSAFARLTILDSFFHKREAGNRGRYPKCECEFHGILYIAYVHISLKIIKS